MDLRGFFDDLSDLSDDEKKYGDDVYDKVFSAIPHYPLSISLTRLARKLGYTPSNMLSIVNAMSYTFRICEDDYNGRLSRVDHMEGVAR